MRISDWSSDVCSSDLLAQTGTSLTVAAYRYSTSGYLSLGDAVCARDHARRGLPVFASDRPAYPLTTNGVPVSDLLTPADRKSVVSGKRVAVRVNLGGRCTIQQKTIRKIKMTLS